MMTMMMTTTMTTMITKSWTPRAPPRSAISEELVFPAAISPSFDSNDFHLGTLSQANSAGLHPAPSGGVRLGCSWAAPLPNPVSGGGQWPSRQPFLTVVSAATGYHCNYVTAAQIRILGLPEVSRADRIHKQLQELATEGILCIPSPSGSIPLLAKEWAKARTGPAMGIHAA